MANPRLNSEQLAQYEHTLDVIRNGIAVAGGSIPFDRYMELALYAPGAGYYVNGARKFGEEGDFVTAPEISSLFSHCLASQCAEVLAETGGSVLEFGAGSGRMAADMLNRLETLGELPQRYQIMELSGELRVRQRETLARLAPGHLERVEWLERLPGPGWEGVIVGNELLDAMPVSRFRCGEEGWQESFIRWEGGGLQETWQQARPSLVHRLDALQHRLGEFAPGYVSEINMRLQGWFEAVSAFLRRGVLLLIDYGYPERAYYHPERDRGTLICHFRHRAHADFLALAGLQDITANVDFSAVAEAGVAAGLGLAGYTTQAQFLIGCGLDREMLNLERESPEDYVLNVQSAKQLVLPDAMGERFQAIAFSRGTGKPLRGFCVRDMRESL